MVKMQQNPWFKTLILMFCRKFATKSPQNLDILDLKKNRRGVLRIQEDSSDRREYLDSVTATNVCDIDREQQNKI